MNRRKNKSRLSYKNLEERRLLAGDVTVVESGHLFIRGDELSNQISIVADESGQIVVSGLRDTTINGSTAPFIVSESINLHGERGRNAAFDGGLRIMTFGGHDRIDIQGIEFGDRSNIITGEGNDFVRFLRSTSQHDFSAVTGAGDDTLNFVQTRVFGDFDVTTADGQDAVHIRNSRTWGETGVFTGSENDTVTLDRVRFTGERQQVLTHDGDDQVEVRNNDVSEQGLDVFVGNGRDHVFAEMHAFNDVAGEILVAGQEGFDVLDLDIDQSMADVVNQSGFVSGTDAEGAWFVYNRGESTSTPKFNYRASAVEFDQTTNIRSLEWLGSYSNSEAPEADNFVVEIFESEAIESFGGGYWYRQPTSQSVARYEIGNDANRLDTGQTWLDLSNHFDSSDPENDGFTRKIFSYSTEIDFEFLAETTYWISIYSMTDADPNRPEYALNDYDFGILLDYPGEPGDAFDYIEPSGTQADPFKNTNAVLFDDNEELGLEPNRWYFNSSEVETLFALRP